MKTNELTGAALDWAVASIEKLPMDLLVWEYSLPVVKRTVLGHTDTLRCEFSTNWAQGGPIIEREGVTVSKEKGCWSAYFRDNLFEDDGSEHWQTGPTPLIAAMRCFVASKLGDEVEVPEELQ